MPKNWRVLSLAAFAFVTVGVLVNAVAIRHDKPQLKTKVTHKVAHKTKGGDGVMRDGETEPVPDCPNEPQEWCETASASAGEACAAAGGILDGFNCGCECNEPEGGPRECNQYSTYN